MSAELPLSPFRVLDLTDEKGFLCGRILGDLGADVIKVEPPEGDPGRRIGPFYRDLPDPQKSFYWFVYNANKRGITLNLNTRDGTNILKRLVATADFVIESFPPGHMQRLGLGYEVLSGLNPSFIMTSITPFGQTGPYACYKASDLVGWAMGGLLYLTGELDRPPFSISIPQAYLQASAEAATASLIAHWHRQATGEGQQVDVSMQQCIVRMLINAMQMWDVMGVNLKRRGYGVWGPRAFQRYSFPCKDGYLGGSISGGGQAGMVASSRAMGAWMEEDGMAPDWLREFDWVNGYNSSKFTQDVVDRVEGTVIAFLKTKTKAEVYEQALRRGIYFAPAATTEDICESPQLAARGFWQEVEHPELGETLTYPGAFIKLSESPLGIRRRAPLIGEHNQEVYGEELGFSREELVLLKQSGVV